MSRLASVLLLLALAGCARAPQIPPGTWQRIDGGVVDPRHLQGAGAVCKGAASYNMSVHHSGWAAALNIAEGCMSEHGYIFVRGPQ
jgi:hypothetical protein